MSIVVCWFQRTLKQLEREQTDRQIHRQTTVTLAHARRGLIRVPPANATHLYIIILNILITSYSKYQILPNPHNTAQFNYACPATAQFNHACPATAQFNYARPATAQFNYALPATAQFNYACPATAQFNYACPATAQFNSRTLLSSSCQPL